MVKQKNRFQFEAALARLEAIVESLEGENKTLEQSLELFEEGVKLAEELKLHLEQAEQKVQVLLKDSSGNLKTEDYQE
ncbi:MAG: exodeoxyribonuclease VII small subunit [Fidelibacterota bacterium]